MTATVVEAFELKDIEKDKAIYNALGGSSSIRRSSRTTTTPLVAPKSSRTKTSIGEKRKDPVSTMVTKKTPLVK